MIITVIIAVYNNRHSLEKSIKSVIDQREAEKELIVIDGGSQDGTIEIINKYVSDSDDESHVRFDTFYKEKKDITFLKIDVDGAEAIVLDSCNEVFKSPESFKVALCTYHKNNDERDFTLLLKNHGFTITPSKGYMIHYYDKKMKAPFLRRGLIRAVR